jgi:type II secretory pathway pseudopilin PulG
MNMKLMDKLMARRSARAQAGFTMVELAIVLVAALKGTDMINKAKVERSVADLKGMQAMILEYQKRTGRLPGDCNNDGKIDYPPEGITSDGPVRTSGVYNTQALDADETHRTLLTLATETGPTASCATSATAETEQNIVWNDLRRSNIVDPQRLPAELAKNASGSFYAVGNMIDTPGSNANVIVVYSIPVWMAEAIEAAIDGVVSYSGTGADDNSAAGNTGRVRRWDENVSPNDSGGGVWTAHWYPTRGFSNGYARNNEDRDTLISIGYQFDVNVLTDTYDGHD